MTAPAELVIEVTADDIRLGKPGSPCQCAVALAAIRALADDWPGLIQVDAANSLRVALYEDPDDWEPFATYPLPGDAAEWVERFDGGDEVAPFTFTARLASAP